MSATDTKDVAVALLEAIDHCTTAVELCVDHIARLKDLLRRISEWDHMDTAADGPYWRREIDAALKSAA